MARLVVLDDDRYTEIASLLSDPATVVVRRGLLAETGVSEAELVGRAEHYDFGGEGDSLVDWVGSKEHWFLRLLRENEEV